MSTTTRQPRSRRYIRVSQQRKTKLRWPENRVSKRTGGATAAVRVYTYVCIQARPVSTNPGCMEEACECGLTRGMCFVALRLEVVAVAGLLWIYSAVCFFRVSWDFVFFCCSFSFLRTHTACCKHEATSSLIYLSTSNDNEARPRERNGKKASSYRRAYRVPLFN